MIEVNFIFLLCESSEIESAGQYSAYRQLCLLRINLLNLCPNVIHIDALDFSG